MRADPAQTIDEAQKENSVSITEHLQVITTLRTTAKEMEEKISSLKEHLASKEGRWLEARKTTPRGKRL